MYIERFLTCRHRQFEECVDTLSHQNAHLCRNSENFSSRLSPIDPLGDKSAIRIFRLLCLTWFLHQVQKNILNIQISHRTSSLPRPFLNPIIDRKLISIQINRFPNQLWNRSFSLPDDSPLFSAQSSINFNDIHPTHKKTVTTIWPSVLTLLCTLWPACHLFRHHHHHQQYQQRKNDLNFYSNF